MLEILQFIFADGWHWAGSFMLLALIAVALQSALHGVIVINHHKHTHITKKDTDAL